METSRRDERERIPTELFPEITTAEGLWRVQERLAGVWNSLLVANQRRFAPLRYMGIFQDARIPEDLEMKMDDLGHRQWQERRSVTAHERRAHDQALAEEFLKKYWIKHPEFFTARTNTDEMSSDHLSQESWNEEDQAWLSGMSFENVPDKEKGEIENIFKNYGVFRVAPVSVVRGVQSELMQKSRRATPTPLTNTKNILKRLCALGYTPAREYVRALHERADARKAEVAPWRIKIGAVLGRIASPEFEEYRKQDIASQLLDIESVWEIKPVHQMLWKTLMSLEKHYDAWLSQTSQRPIIEIDGNEYDRIPDTIFPLMSEFLLSELQKVSGDATGFMRFLEKHASQTTYRDIYKGIGDQAGRVKTQGRDRELAAMNVLMSCILGADEGNLLQEFKDAAQRREQDPQRSAVNSLREKLKNVVLRRNLLRSTIKKYLGNMEESEITSCVDFFFEVQKGTDSARITISPSTLEKLNEEIDPILSSLRDIAKNAARNPIEGSFYDRRTPPTPTPDYATWDEGSHRWIRHREDPYAYDDD